MSGFDDFMNKAEAAARTAAGAARRAAEQARLSIQIAAEEDKLKSAYAELGSLTYAAISTGTDPDDATLERQMAAIRGHMERIRELRRQKDSYSSTGEAASQSASEPAAGEDDFVEIVEV